MLLYPSFLVVRYSVVIVTALSDTNSSECDSCYNNQKSH